MLVDNLYKGLPCYIVGKGRSILNLNSSYFTETAGPIISMYQATRKIENLNLINPQYALFKDGCKHTDGSWPYQHKPPLPAPIGHICNNNSVFYPKIATALLHDKESKNCLSNYSKRIVFSIEELGIFNRKKFPTSFSLECAIKIAIKWGCTTLKILCCDSCCTGDLMCLDFNTDLSYTLRNNTQYPGFCNHVKKLLSTYSHEWITPKS
jgi:hypothetical protein